MIEVRDNGIGIPIEVGDKVFDPYFTLKEDGNGLGLYISKLAVKEHGGKLHYRSNKKGTIFNIYLPLNKEYELFYFS